VYEGNTRLNDEETTQYITGGEEADFGPSRISAPHWINLNAMYRLPSPDGGAAETFLGGWTASVVTIMRSGFPLTIKQSANWGSAFGYDHQRPNTTGVDPMTSGSTGDRVDNFINPAAYENVAPFTFGNTPHTDGDVRSAWLKNWDFSLEKNTALGGGANLIIRLEWVNLFNQPNWNGPGSIFGTQTFGRITGQGGFPRTFQFMAKVLF
jgi:hypothetical protein